MKDRQMSESFAVAALLAVSGGLLDAYTYLCRGGVFANAQTGNIVLLGVNLAAGRWVSALSSLIPIMAFVLGVIITEAFRHKFITTEVHMFNWRQGMLLMEICLLSAVAFVPIGSMDRLVNIVVSFVCSLQTQSFKKVHGYSFASTMCTGNLRNGTEAFFGWLVSKNRDERKQFVYTYAVILFFVIGAALGAWLSYNIPNCVMWFVVCLYVAVLILMTKWDRLFRHRQ